MVFPRMGRMALTEFAVHNVLRTYARQQRIGTALRLTRTSGFVQSPQDRVAPSHEAQNLQQIRRMAAELVGRLHGDLPPLEQRSLTIALEQVVGARHGGRLAGELLPTHVLERWLRSLNVQG